MIKFLMLGLMSAGIACAEGGDLLKNDKVYNLIRTSVPSGSLVAEIDHCRLARAEGAEMGPSKLLIFNDPNITVPIMEHNQEVALDLPLRILVFQEDGKTQVIYTNPEFIDKRHGLESAANFFSLAALYKSVMSDVEPGIIKRINSDDLSAGYGITTIKSKYSFDYTYSILKKVIMSQGDTVWFGEIDFKDDAKQLGKVIRPTTLFLYGGPVPGARAMKDYPRIGLDAFCQKLLVFENSAGEVNVSFNSITALTELHYGTIAPSHKLLDERIVDTFTKVLQ